MKWLLLLLSVIANSAANLLIKLSVMPPRQFPNLTDPKTALTNWPFWLGLALYGGALLLYTAALTRLPLMVAYSLITAGAAATISIGSILLFDEPYAWNTMAGLLLIIAGAMLVNIRPA